MSEQPDLSTLPQRMRYAADVLKEADERYGGAGVWYPNTLLIMADKWEDRDRKTAGREQLVEELATEAYAHAPSSGPMCQRRELWRHRAQLLIKSGWRKGTPNE